MVRVIRGRIRVSERGDDFHGKYPTAKEILTQAKKDYKSFHWKRHGTMLVIVAPCPKGC